MNLLPPQQKEALRKEILLKFGFVVLGVVSLWTAILLILIYNVNLYFKIQIPAINARVILENNSKSSIAYKDVEKRINELNAALVQLDRIRGRGFLNLADVLRKLGSVVLPGIFFSSMSYQGDVISISGHADTREQALALKDALEKGSLCVNLTSPVIVKEVNIDFIFVCSLSKQIKTPQIDSSEEEEGDIFE